MRTATRLLAASSVLMILMGIAHMIGHMQGMKELASPPDTKTVLLVEGMRRYVVPDPLRDRNVLELYLGFSLWLSLSSVFLGILGFLGGRGLSEQPGLFRRFALCYFAGCLALTVLSATYFILPPTIFLAVSTLLAGAAVATARR
jgi:hypothetical protein